MTKDQIIAAISKNGWPYETEGGMRFIGCPVSGLPQLLRDAGWRKVGRQFSCAGELEARGLFVVRARYAGGVRPKEYCKVVFARHRDFNPALHHFMMNEGAHHERIREYWEDIGTPESGPELDGYQALDLYTLDGIHYAAFADGTVERSAA